MKSTDTVKKKKNNNNNNVRFPQICFGLILHPKSKSTIPTHINYPQNIHAFYLCSTVKIYDKRY